MTEAEWHGCTDPRVLVAFLQSHYGRTSIDRKIRMFGLACCRELWKTSTDESTRIALAIVEQFADGGKAPRAVGMVRVPAGVAVLDCDASYFVEPHWRPGGDWESRISLAQLPAGLLRLLNETSCERTLLWAPSSLVESFEYAGLSAASQIDFFRDIVRCPTQPAHFSQSWLRWNEHTVRRLAERVYAEEDFASLPVVGDALEDAGCTSAEILDHCRSPRRHVRGCWVLDLLLGKW